MFERLYQWYGKRVVLSALFCIGVLLICVVYLFITKQSPVVDPVVANIPAVTTKRVGDLNVQSIFSAVGVVQAVFEANLQTEAGGRITSVNTELGKTVAAGTIIASIENASQRAQLLQAEGAYDAAVAASVSGEASVVGASTNLESAQTTGLVVYQDAYIFTDGVLHTTLDEFFTTYNNEAIGFILNGQGIAQQLITERNELEKIFQVWTVKNTAISKDNVVSELDTAYSTVLRISSFIEQLTIIAQNQDLSPQFTHVDKDASIVTLFGVRAEISAILKQIETSRLTIASAAKALEQAKIAGTSGAPSTASAQLKIALGSLRAAQAQYEKTLVRTPIFGVVNALYLKTGEYVSPATPAAIIANNNKGLEVSTSVSQEESVLLTIGDEVKIDTIATGTIAAIGGSIDPTTGKVAVKISVDKNSNLQNGSTVSIAFIAAKSTDTTEVTIPLAAVKMTGSGPVVFTVDSERNVLIANAVTLGDIRGEVVVVISGITNQTAIVLDGRGQKEGTKVTVTNK